MNVPWWAFSPSPFTLVAYTVFTLYGAKQMYDRVISRHTGWRKSLFAALDSFFILFFLVLLLDTVWCVFCGLRFGWYFPDSVMGLVFAVIRNVLLLTVCWVLIGGYFTNGTLTPSDWTFPLFCVNMVFLSLWFWLSPSPAYTDWTFAIRFDYPVEVIAGSFVISHVVGKSILASIFYSYFKGEKLIKKKRGK